MYIFLEGGGVIRTTYLKLWNKFHTCSCIHTHMAIEWKTNVHVHCTNTTIRGQCLFHCSLLRSCDMPTLNPTHQYTICQNIIINAHLQCLFKAGWCMTISTGTGILKTISVTIWGWRLIDKIQLVNFTSVLLVSINFSTSLTSPSHTTHSMLPMLISTIGSTCKGLGRDSTLINTCTIVQNWLVLSILHQWCSFYTCIVYTV